MRERHFKPPTMTELGELNSADKVEHGYTFLYDQIFEPVRYSNVRLLEIGFARGRGARLLAEFFPRGIIHTMDIEPNYEVYNKFPNELGKRIQLWQGDQSSPSSIQKVLSKIYNGPRNADKRGPRKFDIVIDDGSHQPKHQQTSFNTLWPHLNEGGLYIIEDFHPFYKNNKHKTVTWLFDKIHQLNRYGDKHATTTLPEIDWIMFSYNQAVLRKKNNHGK